MHKFLMIGIFLVMFFLPAGSSAQLFGNKSEPLPEYKKAQNEGLLAKSKQLYGQAIAAFSKCLTLSPNNRDCLADRAEVFELNNDLNAALADLTTIIRIYSGFHPYETRGNLYMKIGQWTNALKDFDSSLYYHRSNFGALKQKAHIYVILNKNEDALAAWEKALEAAPESGEAFTGRANAKLKIGDTAGAFRDFAQAIEYDKETGESLIARGLAYQAQKKYLEAQKDFVAASNKSDKKETGYLALGDLFQAQKEYDRAIVFYGLAKKRNFENPIVYNNRACAYLELNKLPEALKDVDEAIRLNRNYWQFWDTKMLVLCRMGMKAEAKKVAAITKEMGGTISVSDCN